MEEVATCRRCKSQTFVIYKNRIECAKCKWQFWFERSGIDKVSETESIVKSINTEHDDSEGDTKASGAKE